MNPVQCAQMSGRRPSRFLFLTGKDGGQKKYKVNEGEKQISTIELGCCNRFLFLKLTKIRLFMCNGGYIHSLILTNYLTSSHIRGMILDES